MNFLLHTEETEKVIDVIEVSFRYIDQMVRDNLNTFMNQRLSYGLKRSETSSPDEAIKELNYQFRDHGVGYQYESGQIIKVDTQNYPFRSRKTCTECAFRSDIQRGK